MKEREQEITPEKEQVRDLLYRYLNDNYPKQKGLLDEYIIKVSEELHISKSTAEGLISDYTT